MIDWTEIKAVYPDLAEFLIDINKHFGKPTALQVNKEIVKPGFDRPKVLRYRKKSRRKNV